MGTLCRKSVPKVRKSSQNEVKIEALRLLWGPLGTHLGTLGSPLDALGPVWRSLWRHFRVPGPTFSSKMSEKSDFVILMPLCSESLTFQGPRGQVGAPWPPNEPWMGPLGQSGRPKWPRTGLAEGFGTAKVALQSGTVCQSYGPDRKSAGNRIKAEVKVYLSDKSYD